MKTTMIVTMAPMTWLALACGSGGGGGASDSGPGTDVNAQPAACAGVTGDGDFSQGEVVFTLDGREYRAGLGPLSVLSEDQYYQGTQTGLGLVAVNYTRCYEITTPYAGTSMWLFLLRVPSKPGTYPLTTQVTFPGVISTPSISVTLPTTAFDVPAKHYEAGYNVLAKCNPCGSGQITVTAFDMASKTAAGTFEFTGVASDLINGPNPADAATFTGSFTVTMK